MFMTCVVLRRLLEDGGFLLGPSTSEPPLCRLGLRWGRKEAKKEEEKKETSEEETGRKEERKNKSLFYVMKDTVFRC